MPVMPSVTRPPGPIAPTRTWADRLGMPGALRWGYVGLLIFMIGDGVESGYLAVFLGDRGLSDGNVGLLFTVYGVAAGLAAWASGALSDLWGPRRVMMIGLVIWVGFQLLMLTVALPSMNYSLLLLCYGFRGLGYPLFAYGFLVWIAAATRRTGWVRRSVGSGSRSPAGCRRWGRCWRASPFPGSGSSAPCGSRWVWSPPAAFSRSPRSGNAPVTAGWPHRSKAAGHVGVQPDDPQAAQDRHGRCCPGHQHRVAVRHPGLHAGLLHQGDRFRAEPVAADRHRDVPDQHPVQPAVRRHRRQTRLAADRHLLRRHRLRPGHPGLLLRAARGRPEPAGRHARRRGLRRHPGRVRPAVGVDALVGPGTQGRGDVAR